MAHPDKDRNQINLPDEPVDELYTHKVLKSKRTINDPLYPDTGIPMASDTLSMGFDAAIGHRANADLWNLVQAGQPMAPAAQIDPSFAAGFRIPDEDWLAEYAARQMIRPEILENDKKINKNILDLPPEHTKTYDTLFAPLEKDKPVQSTIPDMHRFQDPLDGRKGKVSLFDINEPGKSDYAETNLLYPYINTKDATFEEFTRMQGERIAAKSGLTGDALSAAEVFREPAKTPFIEGLATGLTNSLLGDRHFLSGEGRAVFDSQVERTRQYIEDSLASRQNLRDSQKGK